MPYYCTVPRCTSMAGKAKNVSFHQFPRDEELAKLWNKILKRGKPYTKYSKVCSLHFKPEDYTITSVGKNKGLWRTLRKDAIPSQKLPSESPTPYQRKQWGSCTPSAPVNVIDTAIQQQMAQAIYMQTMLAMQAAGAVDINSLQSNGAPQPIDTQPSSSDQDILKTLNIEQSGTSYKCMDCSKCFKDPDVYMLHKRTHTRNETKQNVEKENLNLNLTLRANPILANLLKTNTDPANIYDNNVSVMENLLMTALAANMEGYLKNISNMRNGYPGNDVLSNDNGIVRSNDHGIVRGNDNGSQFNDEGNVSDSSRTDFDDNIGTDSFDSRLTEHSTMNLCTNNKEKSTKFSNLYQKQYLDFNKSTELDLTDKFKNPKDVHCNDVQNNDVGRVNYKIEVNDLNDSQTYSCDNESIDSNNLVIDETL